MATKLEQGQRAESAARHLRACDPRLAAIIDRVGPCRLEFVPDPFLTLTASIIHQQLSMKAAATIRGRVRDLCAGRRIRPDTLAAVPDQALRAAGLSRQKVSFIRDLCAHFLDGRLSARILRRIPDDAVIELATQVKGVGRWTAEMLLMFCLERPDVWPVDDLGLRKGVQLALGRRKPPAISTVRRFGEPLRPYRTYAAWYLWRSLDGPVAPGVA